MDFEFERLGNQPQRPTNVSVCFTVDPGGFPVTANSPEAMILLMLLNEVRALRHELASVRAGSSATSEHAK